MKDIILASREGFLVGGMFIYIYIFSPPLFPIERKVKGINQGEGIYPFFYANKGG